MLELKADAREARRVEDIDIWRAAAHMLKLYGADAAITAAMRADALLDQGDAEGFAVWKRVVSAIGQLERDRGADEPVN